MNAKPPEGYHYEAKLDEDHIKGWYPIHHDRIKDPSKIEEYIQNGDLRLVENSPTKTLEDVQQEIAEKYLERIFPEPYQRTTGRIAIIIDAMKEYHQKVTNNNYK